MIVHIAAAWADGGNAAVIHSTYRLRKFLEAGMTIEFGSAEAQIIRDRDKAIEELRLEIIECLDEMKGMAEKGHWATCLQKTERLRDLMSRVKLISWRARL